MNALPVYRFVVSEKVGDLVAHYKKYGLTLERKAHATVEGHKSYLTLLVLPKWKEYRLSEVKTVAVEQWLDYMTLAPATRRRFATSCLRSIVTASGMSGFRLTRSAKFAVRQNGCVNLMYSHLESFKLCCASFPCASM